MRAVKDDSGLPISHDSSRDRVVPPTGFTAGLTTFTSAAMAFLVVFALSLALAADRLSDRWSAALAGGATLRIAAPVEQMDAQLAQAVKVLKTTPGISEARVIPIDEQQSLLEPWLGPDLPMDALALPRLIDIREDNIGYDAQGLRLRLAAEVPGAVLDDHSRWQRPLLKAAQRVWALGLFAIVLMAATSAAMIMLATRAAMAANAQVVAVLRLIGAQDSYIASAFVRRFTLRAFMGAGLGTAAGGLAVYLLPSKTDQAMILSGLSFQQLEWLWLLSLPPFIALVAFFATRQSTRRELRRLR